MTGDFRTRGGRIFLALSEIKGARTVEATIGRSSGGTTGHKFRCCPGTVGVLLSGPKDWSPRSEPAGFCRWVRVRQGDRLVYSAGRHIGSWNCDRPGWFGLVKRPSPFAVAMTRKRRRPGH